MSLHDRIFSAVFPPSADVVIPTPTATPVLGSTGFSESFGGPAGPDTGTESVAAEQIKWDRAWHAATAFLSVANEPITAAHASQDERSLRAKWIKPFNAETEDAVFYLLSEDSRGRQLRKYSTRDDLLEWYYEELVEDIENESALVQIFQTLQVVQTIYLYPLKHHILPILPDKGSQQLAQAKINLHGLFAHSIPHGAFCVLLGRFLKEQAFIVLNITATNQPQHEPNECSEARQITMKVMKSLKNVGLAGGRAQRLFAEVMNEVLTKHVESEYAGKWSSPSSVPQDLRDWIENEFARFTVEVLACLYDEACEKLTQISHASVQKWQQMGISQLGALRVNELFNVVVDWENGSRGAMEDLKCYINNPSARLHVTQDFSEVISHRLLQPGASTMQILQIYISIIRSFTVLDPRGVLLDRVARPIRRYLRERDDTVNIVVTGLLADPEDESLSPETLVELATELASTGGLPVDEGKGADDGDLDWDDMNWMPDPVDAPADYKRTKHTDVIGALISLFDTKETFLKEFQKILGERLLRREHDFDKEIRVMELLKIRFGESSLQACEVMLRDILDSRRVDLAIRNSEEMHLDTFPQLQSKILSHLFWPSLHTESFAPPPSIADLQTHYEAGFAKLKPSRKLTWLPSLGQVTVHLDLQDRSVREEVQTWQAAVIHAFDSDANGRHCAPVVRTYTDLKASLQMSDALLQNALAFWVAKLVLIESRPDTYRVLETLPSSTTTLTTSFAATTAGGSSSSNSVRATTTTTLASSSNALAAARGPLSGAAVRSEEDMLSEKMEVFWQFVQGMLTNQGPMGLERIVLMLKMVVPGGFPFGNEEMREFLAGKVREGALAGGSGGYRIPPH
ncbi:MAG: hypothetical protein Q9191_004088 [Dirinaria sp. TL-2023a]